MLDFAYIMPYSNTFQCQNGTEADMVIIRTHEYQLRLKLLGRFRYAVESLILRNPRSTANAHKWRFLFPAGWVPTLWSFWRGDRDPSTHTLSLAPIEHKAFLPVVRDFPKHSSISARFYSSALPALKFLFPLLPYCWLYDASYRPFFRSGHVLAEAFWPCGFPVQWW